MELTEPTYFVVGLMVYLVVGALLPIRVETREDYIVLTIVAAAAGAIVGPASLTMVWLAVLIAVPFIVTWNVIPRRGRKGGRRGAVRSIAWVVQAAFGCTVGFVLANLVYSGVFGREFPIRVTSAYEFYVAGWVVVVWVVGVLAVRAVMVRVLDGSFIAFGLDPFDSVLLPYVLPVIGGFPLVTAFTALYAPADPLPALMILWWCFPLYAATVFDLHRRRLAQDLRRDVLAQQRLAAIGEVSARIVHQSRHQVGLMGFSIHRLRGLIGRSDPDGLAEQQSELDALGEAKDRLTEMLASELLHERDDAGAESSDAPAQPALTLDSLIEDVQVQLLTEATSGGITLRTDVAPDAGRGVVARELRDVLFNLVDNAIDAASHEVLVAAERRNGSVVIRVCDDGPGLAERDAAKVFEPFFTTKSDGTGMGLAIADALVGDLGGELRYDRSGGRTEFVVTLHA